MFVIRGCTFLNKHRIKKKKHQWKIVCLIFKTIFILFLEHLKTTVEEQSLKILYYNYLLCMCKITLGIVRQLVMI